MSCLSFYRTCVLNQLVLGLLINVFGFGDCRGTEEPGLAGLVWDLVVISGGAVAQFLRSGGQQTVCFQ